MYYEHVASRLPVRVSKQVRDWVDSQLEQIPINTTDIISFKGSSAVNGIVNLMFSHAAQAWNVSYCERYLTDNAEDLEETISTYDFVSSNATVTPYKPVSTRGVNKIRSAVIKVLNPVVGFRVDSKLGSRNRYVDVHLYEYKDFNSVVEVLLNEDFYFETLEEAKEYLYQCVYRLMWENSYPDFKVEERQGAKFDKIREEEGR